MATDTTALDLAITNIEGEDATLATILTSLITDLEAKSSPSVDLTPEVTRLQNVLTALQGIQNTATAADPGAPVAPAA